MFILWYFLGGFALMYLAAFLHLVSAEKRGYDAINWWNDNGPLVMESIFESHKLAFVIGLCIWPIRLMQFIMNEPEYYELYPMK